MNNSDHLHPMAIVIGDHSYCSPEKEAELTVFADTSRSFYEKCRKRGFTKKQSYKFALTLFKAEVKDFINNHYDDDLYDDD